MGQGAAGFVSAPPSCFTLPKGEWPRRAVVAAHWQEADTNRQAAMGRPHLPVPHFESATTCSRQPGALPKRSNRGSGI